MCSSACAPRYYNILQPTDRPYVGVEVSHNAKQCDIIRIVSSLLAAPHSYPLPENPLPSSICRGRHEEDTDWGRRLCGGWWERAFAIHFSVCAFTSRCRNEEWVERRLCYNERAWTDPWTNGGHRQSHWIKDNPIKTRTSSSLSVWADGGVRQSENTVGRQAGKARQIW